VLVWGDRMSAEHDSRCEREYTENGFIFIDCLCSLRKAKADAWDEGFDAGERDVFQHQELGDWSSECIRNPYRDSEPTS
jgi:hypothetical protein